MTLSVFSRPLCAAALLGLAVVAAPAQAQTYTLTPFAGDTASVNLTVSQLTANSVRFDVVLDTAVSLGDLRGVFFNVGNESLLSGLTITGTDVTQVVKNANSVNNLGGGVNTNPEGNFDVGVEIGSAGIGGNDIQNTSFTVSSAVSLPASLFTSATDVGGTLPLLFAVRATSVGPNGNRNGSSKLGATASSRVNTVPEPASLAFFAGGGLIGLINLRRKRK